MLLINDNNVKAWRIYHSDVTHAWRIYHSDVTHAWRIDQYHSTSAANSASLYGIFNAEITNDLTPLLQGHSNST